MPVEWTYPERNDWLERMASKLFVASVVAVLAAVVGVVVVETDGNMFPAAACIVAAAVLIASCYRVEWGLYVFVGTVLFFDQYAIPGFDPLTFKALYFRNLKEISYLPRFSELVVNPLELQLVLLITVWFVVSCFKRDLSLVRIPMWTRLRSRLKHETTNQTVISRTNCSSRGLTTSSENLGRYEISLRFLK